MKAGEPKRAHVRLARAISATAGGPADRVYLRAGRVWRRRRSYARLHDAIGRVRERRRSTVAVARASAIVGGLARSAMC